MKPLFEYSIQRTRTQIPHRGRDLFDPSRSVKHHNDINHSHPVMDLIRIGGRFNSADAGIPLSSS
jgi:hypothetical protein